MEKDKQRTKKFHQNGGAKKKYVKIQQTFDQKKVVGSFFFLPKKRTGLFVSKTWYSRSGGGKRNQQNKKSLGFFFCINICVHE